MSTRKSTVTIVNPATNPAKFERCVEKVSKKKGAKNAYAICTAAGAGKKKGRRNPGEDYEAAAAASEDFHGTPAHEVFKVEEDVFYHETLSDLGELVYIDVLCGRCGRHTIHVSDFEGARLAQSPKGYPFQLFIKGGDQEVNLEDFCITDPHESEVLGKLKRVMYYTIKKHLGRQGGEANFKHRLGEVSGILPHVRYDTLNKRLYIDGGDYTILPEGIDN